MLHLIPNKEPGHHLQFSPSIHHCPPINQFIEHFPYTVGAKNLANDINKCPIRRTPLVPLESFSSSLSLSCCPRDLVIITRQTLILHSFAMTHTRRGNSNLSASNWYNRNIYVPTVFFFSCYSPPIIPTPHQAAD